MVSDTVATFGIAWSDARSSEVFRCRLGPLVLLDRKNKPRLLDLAGVADAPRPYGLGQI